MFGLIKSFVTIKGVPAQTGGGEGADREETNSTAVQPIFNALIMLDELAASRSIFAWTGS